MATPILRYFEFDHVGPAELRQVALRYKNLAHEMESMLPDGPEKSVALRVLLDSKTAAMRAALDMKEN